MSEILGALFKYLVALLGVAAVAVVLYQVFGSNKTQTAISDLTQLQASIQSFYSGQSTFTSLNDTVAINGKLAPANMIAGASLSNPWGGSVVVNVNAGNAAQFDATETLVPQDGCAKMITAFGAALVGLKVNGTAQTLPMDAGSAVTACGNTTNTMIFTFSR